MMRELHDRSAHAPAQPPRADGGPRPRVRAASEERPAFLWFFDLNGFKGYNDSFGHLAGDALLARLGRRLAEAVGTHGSVYRLGGDEFCALVIAPSGEPARALPPGARGAARRGRRVHRRPPRRARSRSRATRARPTDALRLADQHMYRDKAAEQGRRRGARHRRPARSARPAPPRTRRALERRGGRRRAARALARPRRRRRRNGRDGGRPARRGQARDPRRDHHQGRPAQRERVGVHAPAHGDGRAHHRGRRPLAGADRAARAREPRALGRQGLPRRPRGRGRSRSARASSRSATPSAR